MNVLSVSRRNVENWMPARKKSEHLYVERVIHAIWEKAERGVGPTIRFFLTFPICRFFLFLTEYYYYDVSLCRDSLTGCAIMDV